MDRFVSILGTYRGINVFRQVTYCDHRAAFILQILHVLLEVLGIGIDPWMFQRGHAVETKHGDLSIARLSYGPLEIFHIPIWAIIPVDGINSG